MAATGSGPPLRALALACTLTPAPGRSSSVLMAQQILDALAGHGVGADPGGVVRLVDHTIKPGVQTDMGAGDDWPAIRRRLLDADILVLSTPTWLGQPASPAQQVFERLDAELSEKDEQGRLLTYGKLAIAAVVGNEDGAHHITSVIFQCLNDVGFTLAAGASAYWNGEAMGDVDYQDLPETPEKVSQSIASAAANTAHLARLLKGAQYPPV